MPSLDIERLQSRTTGASFAAAAPFPHIVLDGFLDADAAKAVGDEFASSSSEFWKSYHHFNERKRILGRLSEMGPRTRSLIEELHSPRFVSWLESVTGISGLLADPDMDGGGLHETRRGGFLNIHTDFLAHTLRRNWSRQLNLLLYFNQDWLDEYNGALEFWNADVSRREKSVPPLFNRCVIFQTTPISYHGHPAPLLCPPDRSRKVLALYYYRQEKEAVRLAPTHYKPLPTDSFSKRALIHADRLLLKVYSWLKRYLGLRDETAARILKLFSAEDD